MPRNYRSIINSVRSVVRRAVQGSVREFANEKRRTEGRSLQFQSLEERTVFDGDNFGAAFLLPVNTAGPEDSTAVGEFGLALSTFSTGAGTVNVNLQFGGAAKQHVDYEAYYTENNGNWVLFDSTVAFNLDVGQWSSTIYIVPYMDAEYEMVEDVTIKILDGDRYSPVPFDEVATYITDSEELGALFCQCDCGCNYKTDNSQSSGSGGGTVSHSTGGGLKLENRSGENPHPLIRVWDDAPQYPETIFAHEERPTHTVVHSPTSADVTTVLLDAAGNEIAGTSTTKYYDGPAQTYETDIELVYPTFFAFEAQVDASALATGVYRYRVTIVYDYDVAQANPQTRTKEGNVVVVNGSSSPYGNRWSVTGLDRLHVQTSGVTGALLERGNGEVLWYEKVNGAYQLAQGDSEIGVITTDVTGFKRTNKFNEIERFDSAGRLFERIDANGNKTSYQYDGQGRVLSVTDPMAQATGFTYTTNGSGNLVIGIDEPGGRHSEAEVESGSGLLLTITDPDPDGAGGSGQSKVTTFTYDWNPLTQTGAKLLMSYSTGVNQTTSFQYNEFRQLTRVTQPDGSFVDLTPEFSVGLVGAGNSPQNRAPLRKPWETFAGENPGRRIDELENTVVYTVDQFGLVASEDVAGLGRRNYIRTPHGELRQQRDYDPDGVGPLQSPVTDYEYDANFNLTKMTLPLVGGVRATREWVYNILNKPIQYKDEYDRVTVYEYDTAGNLKKERVVIDGTAQTAGALDVITEYDYSPAPTAPNSLPGGLMTKKTDPLGRETTYQYYTDSVRLGRLKQVNYPDGTHVGYDYDAAGNLIAETDELGRTTNYGYDNLGRQTSVTLPDPDTTDSIPAPTTTYTYHHGISYEQVTGPDPDGNGPRVPIVTTYQYLDFNKHVVITETSRIGGDTPSQPIVRHEYYDSLKNLIAETDPLGRTTTYTYDDFGRMETMELPDPGGEVTLPTPAYTYAYDNLGRLTSLTNPAPGVYSQPTANASFSDDPYEVSDMVPMTLVELSGQTPAFHDAQDDPDSLRYEIVGNTNAALFHTLYIAPEQGHVLIAAYAQGVIGEAEVTIRATNSRGLSQTRVLSFDRTAANASERLVNTTTTGAQLAPVTQALAGGKYVVVWQGEGTGDADGVFFQLYGADDAAIGGETRVNVTTAGAQSQPAVAADDDGGFAIVWTEQPTSGNTRVMFRQYADDGSALTGELTASTNNSPADAQPDIAYVASGSDNYFVVVWQGSVSGAMRDNGGSYSDADGVFSRAYQQGTGGWSWNNIQIVNTTTTGAQQRPTVAATRNGGYSVAWETPGSSSGIFLQRYVTPTMQAGGETRVSHDYSGMIGSAYAVMSDGGLVIAWELSLGSFVGVAARMFAADGTPVGQEFIVSGLATKPAVAISSEGFAIGYLWSGADPGVYVARYNPDGSLASAAARISDLAQPTPTSVDLSGSEDGRLIATWARAAGSDTNNAYVKMLAPLPVSFAGGPQRVQALYPDRTILASADQIMVILAQPAASLDINKVQVARVTESGEAAVALQSAVRISELQYLITFQAAASVAGTYRVRVLADAVPGGLDQDQDGTAGETTDDRFAGAFTIAAGSSAQAGVTSYQYDALGRVTQETDPAGNIKTYAYGFESNGNRTTTETILDPDGAGPLGNLVTKSEYDDLDRLVKETLPGAGAPYREYFYDKAGNLVRQRDALGNYTDYRYDSRDRQIRRFEANAISGVASTDALDNLTLTSGQGPITISTYTATGQLATVTDPRDGLTTYEYDRLDRLKKLIQPSAILIGVSDAATEYAYDYAGNLVKVTQPNPRAPGDSGYNVLDVPVTEYEYDRQNNRVKMIQPAPFPGGNRPEFDYTYDDAGQLKSQTDPLDRRTDYDYDGLGRLKQVLQPTIDLFGPGERAETTFTYDTLGNVLRETDPLGNVTQHLYDSASRRVATIDAMGSVAAISYDALGQVIATTDELGRVTRYGHDAWGNQTLVHQNDPLDLLPSATSPKTIYAYDAEGNLLSVTDPRQNVIDYAYDKLNRLTSVTQPAPQVGQSRPVTEYDYSDAGDLTSQTDPEGRVTRYTYDYLGQQTSLMAPDAVVLGGVNGAVTNYQYDRLGRLVKEIAPDPLTLGGTNRPETKYGYDLLGRMTSQTDPAPDGAGGQSPQTTQFSFDAAGQLQFVLGPAGSQYYAYDDMGRRFFESNNSGQNYAIHAYDLAGNLFIELDRLGQVRVWTYDGLNRLVEAVDSRDGLTGYEYDAAGNRTLLVDPVGNETSFQYDQLNRLARETDPLGHARSFDYDANGNLTSAIDRLGREIELGYDALNRKTSETWKDAAGVLVGAPLEWDYDQSGRLLSSTSAAASYDYTYDPAGQLDTLTSNLAGLGQAVVVDQAHNYLGRRKQLKTTIGGTADLVNDYAYDNLSRLKQVTQAAQAGGATVAEKRVDFTYEADNQIDTISRYKALAGGAGNLVAASDYAYDALRRLTDINNSPAQSSDWHWDYDAENQVTEFESTTSAGTANIAYAYDANGQLIGAAGAQTRSYVWDLNGNRRNYQDVGGANNQLTETATHTYAYDDEGNRSRGTLKSTGAYEEYTWDHRNRLTLVQFRTSGGTLTKQVAFAYDAADRKVSKSVDAAGDGTFETVEYYVWDQDTPSGSDNVLFDFVDSDGPGAGAATLTTRYLLGDAVDQVLAQEDVTTSEVLWLLQDNLGSVRETVKNDGTVNSRVDFDPFGNMISIIDPSNGGAATTLKTRLNFTGQEYDADLRLVWYSDGTGRGRWYDPATGTFINHDALGFAAGDANLYRYVENGVTYAIDPSGLCASKYPGTTIDFDEFTRLQKGFSNDLLTKYAQKAAVWLAGKLAMPTKSALKTLATLPLTMARLALFSGANARTLTAFECDTAGGIIIVTVNGRFREKKIIRNPDREVIVKVPGEAFGCFKDKKIADSWCDLYDTMYETLEALRALEKSRKESRGNSY